MTKKGKLTLTPQQEEIVKAFTADEKKAFDALPSDERRIETIDLILSQRAALATFEGVEFDAVETGDDREDVPIYSAGGLGCPKGTVLVGEFLGTMPMFSFEVKENWERETAPNGKVFYRNMYYLFRDPKTGKKFGLYKAPCLNKVLPKIPTKESCRVVPKNPLIKIEYVGKVVGRDILKDKYDLEISSGNEAHVHLVQVEKGVKYDRFASGVKNLLKNPIPNLGESDKLDYLAQSEKDWNQLEMLNGNDQAAITGQGGHRNALDAPAH